MIDLMTMYFFDCLDGDNTYRDTVGISCRDLAEVRYRAVDALPDIVRDELPDGDERSFEIRVRDECGKPVFRCWLTFRLAWL